MNEELEVNALPPQGAKADNTPLHEKLEVAFKKEREELGAELKKLYSDLKKNDRLIDLQVESLSRFQQCLELISQYKAQKVKRETMLNKKVIDGFKKYSTNSPYKLTSTEKTTFAKADNADDQMIVSLLDVQIEFYYETMTNLKNLNYAIKNRLEMLQMELV